MTQGEAMILNSKSQRCRNAPGLLKTGIGAFTLLLSANLALAEDARVLPAGRSRLSFIFAQSGSIDSTFNGDGGRKGITDPYNLKLDAASLAKFDPQVQDAYAILDGLGFYYDPALSGTPSQGVTKSNTGTKLSEHLSKGDLGVNAEAQRRQYSISLQHGLTDQISVGFMIPIMKTRVRTKYGISGNQSLASLMQQLQGYSLSESAMQQIYNGLAYLDGANTETLQSFLTSNGYQRFGDAETTGLGDIVLGGRYNYLKTRREDWISSAQLGFTLPTGELKSPSSITGVDNGQGVFDFGVAHILNYNSPIMNWKWLFSHGIHYTHRLPGSRTYRVKANAEDFLPTVDEKVDMQLGDKFWTNLGAEYKFSGWISAETNYEWYWKAKDRYSGPRNFDYGYLSDETSLYLETWNLGLKIDTISAFLRHSFPLPATVSFNYFYPTRGRNALIAAYGTMEIALYF